MCLVWAYLLAGLSGLKERAISSTEYQIREQTGKSWYTYDGLAFSIGFQFGWHMEGPLAASQLPLESVLSNSIVTLSFYSRT